MKTIHVLLAALVAVQAQSVFAMSGGDFTSNMTSLYEAACAGVGSGHAGEQSACLKDGYAFLHDPDQPAPCTSYRQDEYAFGLLQTVCTKSIGGQGWAESREGCMNAAKAEMQKLGMDVPGDEFKAATKCGMLHLHFSDESRQQCREKQMEKELALAKQDENVNAMEEEGYFKQAIESSIQANKLQSEGALRPQDRGCFAPIASGTDKIGVTDIDTAVEGITCAMAPQDCQRAANALSPR